MITLNYPDKNLFIFKHRGMDLLFSYIHLAVRIKCLTCPPEQHFSVTEPQADVQLSSIPSKTAPLLTGVRKNENGWSRQRPYGANSQVILEW